MSSIVASGSYRCEIDVTRGEHSGMSRDFLATAARIVFINAKGDEERIHPRQPFREHASATRDGAHRLATQEFKTWVADQRPAAMPPRRR
jgi:hypothetical protein